jgi:hypothetical protein
MRWRPAEQLAFDRHPGEGRDPLRGPWQNQDGLQSPSMDFALRASLRLFKLVPDEFVRPAPE